MLLIFNIIILSVFAWEVNKTCEVMENKETVQAIKIKALLKVILLGAFAAMALFVIYRLYGLDAYNLDTYLQSGKI